MIDSTDKERIDEAREELRKVIYDREMGQCTRILVYANKQDLKGALS